MIEIAEPCAGGCGCTVRVPLRFSGTGICATHPCRAPKSTSPGRGLVLALVERFDRATLKHLAKQVEKRRRWLFRRGKAYAKLAELRNALEEAYGMAEKPAVDPETIHLFASLDAKEPVEVRLADGTVTADIPRTAESYSLLPGARSGFYFVEVGAGRRYALFLTARHKVSGACGDGVTTTVEDWYRNES